MARLSNEKIAEIQKLYAEIGIYSQVAKKVGCSPSTVKKYCNDGAAVTVKKEVVKFNGIIPTVDEVNLTFFLDTRDNLTTLTPDEKEELKGLWEEL